MARILLVIAYLAHPVALAQRDDDSGLLQAQQDLVADLADGDAAEGSEAEAQVEPRPSNRSKVMSLLHRAREDVAIVNHHFPDPVSFASHTYVYRRIEAEWVMPSHEPVNKILLASINVMFLGLCGLDRCYMGMHLIGMLKFLTGGGFLVLFIVDFFEILINCVMMSKTINFLGYKAKFEIESVYSAYAITLAQQTVLIVATILVVIGRLNKKSRRQMEQLKLKEEEEEAAEQVQERAQMQAFTTPQKPARHHSQESFALAGSGAAPPRGGSGAALPRGGSGAAPPRGGSVTAPPRGGSGAAPPRNSGVAPPRW